MSKLSTGICNQLLSPGGASIGDILHLGFLRLFSGAAPATADAAETGTLITIMSNNSTGTGLTFEAAAVLGVLAKKISEVWSGLNLAGGTVTWFRFVAVGDTGAISTTQPRIQGTIGTGGAVDFVIATPLFVNGATFTDSSFTISLAPG